MRAVSLLFATAMALAVLGLASRAGAEDKFVQLLLKKGDKAYDARATSGQGEKAKEAYEKVLAVDSQNIEARWKLGRTLYWLGGRTDSRDKQMELFEAGIRYCQEAAKIKDDCVECHFWLAVSYGRFGEAKGILQSLGLVPYMREALEKARKLDDKYEWGGAYRVLGRLEFKLPSGDNKKAVEYLEKAIAIGPNHLMNHRFLAEVLLKEKQTDKAKELLKKIIETPEAQLMPDKKPELLEEQGIAKELWLKQGWQKTW
jgi:tetratricopeptide (TPR) repeat protein